MDSSTANSTPLDPDWYQRHFDHYSPELASQLYDTLGRMREQCPVTHSDQHDGFWVVTKYEDVLEVAQDWETFSSAHGLTVPRAPIAIRNLPVEVDPPIQRTYKQIVNPYFTPKAVAGYEKPTRELINRLIDNFIERGECEFMDEFARKFPSRQFFEMVISAPPADIDRVAYMASKASLPNDPEAKDCWIGLSAWIRDFIADRRRRPERGDVIDAIVHSTIEGRPVTDDEIIGMVQLIILGGLETTASALGLWLHRFTKHPEIPTYLRENPDRIADAVEELLRLDSPFISEGRTAVKDGEIGGCPVHEGEKVILYWASANRDADEFEHADDFDIDRGKNRHMAFGIGPHRCLGSNLARLNLRIGLEELLARLHNIQLGRSAEVHFHSTSTRAPLSLPITFTPGPKLSTAEPVAT